MTPLQAIKRGNGSDCFTVPEFICFWGSLPLGLQLAVEHHAQFFEIGNLADERTQ
jgi:hypothetical protein